MSTAFIADAGGISTVAPPKPPRVSLEGVQVVLLDIEGTTTPITFVHDKLFPYARSGA